MWGEGPTVQGYTHQYAVRVQLLAGVYQVKRDIWSYFYLNFNHFS